MGCDCSSVLDTESLDDCLVGFHRRGRSPPTHPSQIAREAHFFERAVQGTLVDMSQSRVVGLRVSEREKHFWLKPERCSALLNWLQPFTRRVN